VRSPESRILSPAEVREKFHRVKPLKEISIKQRGWTLDVLNIVERVVAERGSVTRSTSSLKEPNCGSQSRAPGEFTNEDIYAHARELEQLHPDNRHIRDKIRQQLQVLRDTGFLAHPGSGKWRLR
jgi:type II restriction enzyme